MLKITNSLTGKKEPFKPLQPHEVKLYVCGITPYDYAHVGHGRVYVTFDVLVRLLQFLGYQVSYCRNYTDIEDKLLIRAEQTLGNRLLFEQIANTYIDSYIQEMNALNCLPPTYEPRVTEHITEIISFIDTLVQNKKAYVVDGNVYFDIQSFADYAKLSKHKLKDLRAGERVEVNIEKKDPLDFALWKKEERGFWQSPWGIGRPGWHIECSALALAYLGEQIDIHGGGMDLMFPHHENEIAQTESITGKPFARYWMHNAFVRINKEKMSKSLGNFYTLKQVFEQFHPLVVRFYYLNHHYKTPLDFSFDDLATAHKTYQRLARFFAEHECYETVSYETLKQNSIVQEMLAMLCDDLNTPGMFGVLFSKLDEIKADETTFCNVKQFLQMVLGLPLEELPEKEVEITPEIQKLLDERSKARKEKNWQRADEIRDQLKKMGVEVHDKKMN